MPRVTRHGGAGAELAKALGRRRNLVEREGTHFISLPSLVARPADAKSDDRSLSPGKRGSVTPEETVVVVRRDGSGKGTEKTATLPSSLPLPLADTDAEQGGNDPVAEIDLSEEWEDGSIVDEHAICIPAAACSSVDDVGLVRSSPVDGPWASSNSDIMSPVSDRWASPLSGSRPLRSSPASSGPVIAERPLRSKSSVPQDSPRVDLLDLAPMPASPFMTPHFEARTAAAASFHSSVAAVECTFVARTAEDAFSDWRHSEFEESAKGSCFSPTAKVADLATQVHMLRASALDSLLAETAAMQELAALRDECQRLSTETHAAKRELTDLRSGLAALETAASFPTVDASSSELLDFSCSRAPDRREKLRQQGLAQVVQAEEVLCASRCFSARNTLADEVASSSASPQELAQAPVNSKDTRDEDAAAPKQASHVGSAGTLSGYVWASRSCDKPLARTRTMAGTVQWRTLAEHGLGFGEHVSDCGGSTCSGGGGSLDVSDVLSSRRGSIYSARSSIASSRGHIGCLGSPAASEASLHSREPVLATPRVVKTFAPPNVSLPVRRVVVGAAPLRVVAQSTAYPPAPLPCGHRVVQPASAPAVVSRRLLPVPVEVAARPRTPSFVPNTPGQPLVQRGGCAAAIRPRVGVTGQMQSQPHRVAAQQGWHAGLSSGPSSVMGTSFFVPRSRATTG